MLLLQEFTLITEHHPGMQHVVGDFLSRVGKGETARKDDNDFRNANVLGVTMISSWEEKNFPDRWLMEMTYFLTT